MAVGEALTNLASAVSPLTSIKLSANWMAAAGYPGEDAALYDTVKAVALELCPALGISIPVGKDSLSMRTAWDDKEVVAPLSLIVSAFAPLDDARAALTPQLRTDAGETELVLVDLGRGQNRLGGSILAQVFGQLGDECPGPRRTRAPARVSSTSWKRTPVCCSPTTTARTAGCSPRCARWPSPATAASRSASMRSPTMAPPTTSTRSSATPTSSSPGA